MKTKQRFLLALLMALVMMAMGPQSVWAEGIEQTEPAQNEIWYTSTDEKIITPYIDSSWDVSVSSNVYQNGRGVITFDKNLTEIGDEAFNNNTFMDLGYNLNLESIIFPEGVTKIGDSALSWHKTEYNGVGLKSVTIPSTVTELGTALFINTDIDNLYLKMPTPANVTIGEGGIFNDGTIGKILVPEGCAPLYRESDNWKGYNIKEMVDGPADNEIWYTTSDNQPIIFEDGTCFGFMLDYFTNTYNDDLDCYVLSFYEYGELQYPVKVTELLSCNFSEKSTLTSVTFPSCCETIHFTEFAGCSSLSTINLPEGLKAIYDDAFNGNACTSITIPSSVTSIGDGAFASSTLKDVYVKHLTPMTGCSANAFTDCSKLALHVPEGKACAYAASSGIWSTFGSISVYCIDGDDDAAVTGHTLTAHPAAAATCTTEGYNSDCWSCSVCGNYFSDAGATTVIEASTVVIPATGHNLNSSGVCTQCDGISYRVPVYNTAGVPTSGIKSWETKMANATQISNSATRDTLGTAGKESWYYVSGNVTLSEGASCAGAVHLILCDGAKLTATGKNPEGYYTCYAGIQVTGNNSLTIYAQSEGSSMGALEATGYARNRKSTMFYRSAGIGGNSGETGNNITIYGGKIMATGAKDGNYSAAGIGGGLQGLSSATRKAASNIYINPALTTKAGSSANPTGVVTNTGGDIASTINNYQYVTVHLHPDGTPTWSWADDASNATATIPCSFGDGSVTLSTTTTPAVSITSEVTTQPTCGTAGTTTYNASVTYNCITYNAPEKAIQNIPATGNHHFVNGVCTHEGCSEQLTYRAPTYNTDSEGEQDRKLGIASWSKQLCPGATATQVTSSTEKVTWNAGWYYVKGEVTLTQGAVCSGAVHLILCDSAKLTVNGGDAYVAGISVTGGDNSLSIYAQSEGAQMGTLSAYGGLGGAGIGGGAGQNGQNITINGGSVSAIGQEYAAGIGGGQGQSTQGTVRGGDGFYITINGGTVEAGGSYGGAGIGGGDLGNGRNITINGGTVVVSGSLGAAGIGGGGHYSDPSQPGGFGYNITINGGKVTAYGISNAIGSGDDDENSQYIYISTACGIKAGSSADDATDEITNDGGDLASSLAGKLYVIIHQHDYKDGTCTVCGAAQPATLVTSTNYEELGLTEAYVGYYAIGNVYELRWWANNKSSESAVLTADISMESVSSWYGVNVASGKTFDGNGHAIEKFSANCSLFYSNNGTIKSLALKQCTNSISMDSYFGCLCKSNESSGIITNCYIDGATISLMGSPMISSCYLGALCSQNSGMISNCFTVNVTISVSGTTTLNPRYEGGICAQNTGTVKNCYTTYTGREIGYNSGTAKHVATKTAAAFASGEVAWLLNGSVDAQGNWTAGLTDGSQAWYQKLTGEDADATPVLTAAADGSNTVYCGYDGCEATEQCYANHALHATQGHNFDADGTCTLCGCKEVTYLAADGSTQKAVCKMITPEMLSQQETDGWYYFLPSGWYAVSGTVDLGNKTLLPVNSAECNLILMDGAELKANGRVLVVSQVTLNLYVQKLQTGKIDSYAENSSSIEVFCGELNVYGGTYIGYISGQSGSTINIYNGKMERVYSNEGNLSVYGGEITSPDHALYIYDSNVTLYNCTLSGSDGAILFVLEEPTSIVAPNSLCLDAKGDVVQNIEYSNSGALYLSTLAYYRIAAKTPGDVNLDGHVSIADLAQTVAIVKGATDKYGTADINGDGSVTDDDVSALRDKILEVDAGDDTNLLPGVFSVSATKKVQFTKGNLYCNASISPATFAFEEHQYDFPTSYDKQIVNGLWNCDHVGHFFWSNYTDYTRTDEHAHEYKPYYSSIGASSKSTTDEFWCSEDHPLEVAGTQGLYALSAEEWYYLTGMFTYASYSDVRNETNRFANAMVNGKVGLLIFPDGYNGTTKLTGITGIAEVNNDETAYPTESIPTATWSDMEAAGVVFLPAAGYRGVPDGQAITPGYCQYWSSTPYSDNVERAYGLYGTAGGEFTCPGQIKREYGSSIRLVKTVE